MKNHYDIVRNRFDLIDDDKNKFENVSRSGFISHRHSQSVLSILAKLKTVNSFLLTSPEWALDKDMNRTFSHLEKYPIIAKFSRKKYISSIHR